MRLKYTFLLFFLMSIFAINACKKDPIEKENLDPQPIIPDLGVKITSSIAGFVMDQTGDPVAQATITVGTKQVRTDEYGYFKVSDASVPKVAGLIKVVKSGYMDAYKTVEAHENKESFVRIKLLSKNEAGIIDATVGGTAVTTDGGKVSLPAHSVVIDNATKSAYTGQIHVNAHWINPADNGDLQMSICGDGRGIDSDGYLKGLKSFSTLAVELTGDNGQRLQMAEGKLATIHLPIPSALVSEAPVTIPMWCFSTDTGLWKQEGTATKTGDAYTATVSHFSFWEAAQGFAFVNVSAQIVDASAQPLTNVPVRITIAGMPVNAGHSRFGFTDANGYISGAVFANQALVLDILTPCASSAYSHQFSTASSDLNLGTLTGNLGQSQVTISGTASNCNNQLVTNGYVQTYDGGFYNRIAINNGNFSYTGLACTNMDVNVVVVDKTTYQQNNPQMVALHSGINNLGALTACGISTMGSITYVYDGITTTIAEPADTIGAYAGNSQNSWTQIIVLSGNSNTAQKMSFQFNGGIDPNANHHLTEVFSTAFPSGRGYWPQPVQVTITEYGNTGGFVSGTFNSQMLDFGDNSLHTLSCTFRVRRNH